MYPPRYQYTHDIDWFCLIDDVPVHLASNGGELPDDSYKASELVSIQRQVPALEPIYKYELNMPYLEQYLNDGRYDDLRDVDDFLTQSQMPETAEMRGELPNLPLHWRAYCWSFIEMAKRGFFSFDRTVNDKDRDGIYHLVAYPIYDREELIVSGIKSKLVSYDSGYHNFSDWLNQMNDNVPFFDHLKKNEF